MPNAPYVCIEPWFGINDIRGVDAELSQKKGILSLEPGKSFFCEYTITVQ